MAACSICARSKGSNQCVMGLPCPLPTPHPPWAHIALDFVPGLPPSDGNSYIKVVDRFSKMVHFFLVKKKKKTLPSAKETAELMLHHVYRLLQASCLPRFQALEREVAVPSAAALILRCHQIWAKVLWTLLRTSACYKARSRIQGRPASVTIHPGPSH